MMNLKNLLTKPLQLIPKWFPITIFLLAVAGFIDATYLTIEHFANKFPPCAIGGCETVLSSTYSQVFGIPVALVGAVFYLTVLISVFIYFDSKKDIFLKVPMILSIGAFFGSLYFISIMAFVLKALCPYCAVSAITSISIFICSFVIVYKNHERPGV